MQEGRYTVKGVESVGVGSCMLVHVGTVGEVAV